MTVHAINLVEKATVIANMLTTEGKGSWRGETGVVTVNP